MNTFSILAKLTTIVMTGLALTGCSKDIVVVAHSECVDLQVGDEKVGALSVNEKAPVTIQGYGAIRVTWVNAEGVDVTDTIWGEDAQDNDKWHLYLEYGSFKTPEEGGSENDTEIEGENGDDGDGESEEGDTASGDDDTGSQEEAEE